MLTVALADGRIENSLLDTDPGRERPLFIGAHQARVAHHVGGEDRGEAPRGHSGMPAVTTASRIAALNVSFPILK